MGGPTARIRPLRCWAGIRCNHRLRGASNLRDNYWRHRVQRRYPLLLAMRAMRGKRQRRATERGNEGDQISCCCQTTLHTSESYGGGLV